jgi:hypothetical protein
MSRSTDSPRVGCRAALRDVCDVARDFARVSRGRVDAELALGPVAVAQDPADAVELSIASGLARVRRDFGKRALDETRDGHRPTAREVDDGRQQSVARRTPLVLHDSAACGSRWSP